MKYCKNCGAELLDEAHFCKYCGTPTTPAATQPSSTYAATQPSATYAATRPSATPNHATTQELKYPPYPGKPNSKLYIIIAVLALIIVAGGIVGFVLWNKSTGKSGEATTDSIATTTTGTTTTTPPTPTTENGNNASSQEVNENTNEAMEATNNALNATSARQLNTDNIDGIVSIYHTNGFPQNSDMAWWSNDVCHHGVPSGVERLTSYSDVTDGWKLMIYNDAGNKNGCENIEFCNIRFSGTADNVVATILCYATYIIASNEVLINDDLTPQDTMEFTGSFRNGKITLNGIGNIYITDLWEKDGKQYAIGRYDSPDGIPAKVALVRP